ncbi:MAG: ribose transport system ATP-binding protein [Solirubrobacteraceae bacterium]
MARDLSDQHHADQPVALALEGVTKRFGGQFALRGVDLELRAGDVHAFLGQNGSGKSTLIKVLAGFHEPDRPVRGAVFGAPLAVGSAAAAHDAGIRFVHQDPGVIDELDIVDNLALGGDYTRRGWLSDRRERAATRAWLGELGIVIDPTRLGRDLTPAQRTMLAVARALRPSASPARILVLDEVTASLPQGERALVFGLVRRVRDRGGTVLYVTHLLDEVFELADRVTVLRDGRRVATRPVQGLDHDGLVELILGRPAGELYPPAPEPGAERVLSARGLSGDLVADVDFDVHRGEVLGVAGLAGSGREELPYLLFGARSWTSGLVTIDGRMHARLTPSRAIASGLALIPADRPAHGSTPQLSVRENVTLPQIPAGRLGRISAAAERANVAGWIERLQIVPRDAEAPFATLSGGNQQKAVLARWFRCAPSVLILDEPTQGVDVGSKAAIYRHLAEGATAGLAVVVSSSDHEELAALCDRVLIMRGGRVAAELSGAGLDADAISEQILATADRTAAGARRAQPA